MPTPPITPQEAKRNKDAIENALRAGYAPPHVPAVRGQKAAISVAASALGIVRRTLSDRVHSGTLKALGHEPDWSLYKDAEGFDEIAPQGDSDKDEIKSLRRRVKELEQQDKLDKVIQQIIGNISDATCDPPGWTVRPKSKGKGAHVPLTIWSDWHAGEVVSPHEVHNLNEFNSQVLERRVRTLVEKTIHICRHHGPGGYPGAVIGLLGDFISGGLHPELVRTDDLTIQQSVLHVRDLLVWALEKMAGEFGRLFVICTSGNHGRSTPKPEYKMTVFTNFDWLIYELLRRHFHGRKDIVIQNPATNEVHFRIFGKRYLATHGDMLGVRGGDGIIGSVGPIMRGSLKVGKQAASYGHDFDCLIMGHWHQALYLPGIVVANTLKGYDEYAARALRAPPSTPSQPLIFVNEQYGHVSYSEIFLESPVEETKSEWVQWAKAG